MSLTPMDQTVMSSTHLPFALRQCVYDVNNATSHAAVSRALCRLRWYLVVTTPVPPVLQHLNSVLWRPAIARYVSCVLCCAATHPLDGAGTGGIVYLVCPSHLCLQTCICVCSGRGIHQLACHQLLCFFFQFSILLVDCLIDRPVKK